MTEAKEGPWELGREKGKGDTPGKKRGAGRVQAASKRESEPGPPS